MSVLVEDNPARRRFEILVDGSLAGFVSYEPRQDLLVLTHTEIDPNYQGMGLGGVLADGALEQIRERGDRIISECSFISTFIDRNPQYAGLLGSV